MENNQEEKKEDLKQKHAQYLDQIFDHNYAWKRIEVIPNKLIITVRTLSADQQISVDDSMVKVKGNQSKLLRLYALEVLGYAILKWNGEPVTSPDSIKERLKNYPGVITEKLVRAQREFEKDVAAALGVTQLKKDSSPMGSQQTEPKPSQKESNSEKEDL